MNEKDDIPLLLDMCQQQDHTRPVAQLALERYRSTVLKLAYGPGTSVERKEACDKARTAFEFELREILVPFLTAPDATTPNDEQKDNRGQLPTGDANG